MSSAGKFAQLWSKGLPMDAVIHRFTVGDDPALDRRLLAFDALGSAAHARMLAHVGLIRGEEAKDLVCELKNIAGRALRGEITIQPEQEDAHTAIESLLVDALGETGKRLHLGRSRNDQVILSLRLYMRQAVLDIAQVIKVGDLDYPDLEILDPHRSMIVSVVSSRVAMKSMTVTEEGAEAEEGAEEAPAAAEEGTTGENAEE